MIAGIDPSLSGTAIYCNDGEHLLIKTTNKDNTDLNRMKYIVNTIITFLKANEITTVGIEGFSYGSRGRSISQMFGLGWLIRYKLSEEGIEYYDIPPHSWKKFLFNKVIPKGGKDLIILETYKKYDKEISNNNLCDSFNIMKFTETLINNNPETKVRKELINKVRKLNDL